MLPCLLAGCFHELAPALPPEPEPPPGPPPAVGPAFVQAWTVVSGERNGPALAEVELWRHDRDTPEVRVTALTFLEAGTLFVQMPQQCFAFKGTSDFADVPEHRFNRLEAGHTFAFVSAGWVFLGGDCVRQGRKGHLSYTLTGRIFGDKGHLSFDWDVAGAR